MAVRRVLVAVRRVLVAVPPESLTVLEAPSTVQHVPGPVCLVSHAKRAGAVGGGRVSLAG